MVKEAMLPKSLSPHHKVPLANRSDSKLVAFISLLHLITGIIISCHYKSDSLRSIQMTTISFSSLTNTKAHPTNLQQATPHSITPFLSQTVHKRNLLILLNSLSFFFRSLLGESTLDNGTKGRRRKNACLHITAVKPQQTRPKRTATV